MPGSCGGLLHLKRAANASIENFDRRQRKIPFVHSPKNFHIGEGPIPDSGDHTGSFRKQQPKHLATIRINTMKAKKKAATTKKAAPAAKKPAAKKKAKK
jgi:hypothetical protein